MPQNYSPQYRSFSPPSQALTLGYLTGLSYFRRVRRPDGFTRVTHRRQVAVPDDLRYNPKVLEVDVPEGNDWAGETPSTLD